MIRWVAGGLLTVLLAGCTTAPPFDSADALSRTIDCDQRVDITSAGQRRNGISVQECVIEGATAIVSVFEEADTHAKFLEALRQDVSATRVLVVVGDRFAVQTKSDQLADEIAEATGGRVIDT